VIDMVTRQTLLLHSDGAERLSCVQYAPNGGMLAIGSHDGSIHLYAVEENGRKYSRFGRCSGHSGYVSHVDWSSCGNYLRSNGGSNEIGYWEAKTGKPIQSVAEIRGIQWATDSCTLSFQVAGQWPENADGGEIASCDRNRGANLLASSDQFGNVKLFQYPCAQPKSEFNLGSGHCGNVSSVRFLSNDIRLISTGDRDATIIQWCLD